MNNMYIHVAPLQQYRS